jgi:hypothetical protein
MPGRILEAFIYNVSTTTTLIYSEKTLKKLLTYCFTATFTSAFNISQLDSLAISFSFIPFLPF